MTAIKNSTHSEFTVEHLSMPESIESAIQNPFTLSLTVSQENLGSTIAHVSNVEYLRWIDRISDLHGNSCRVVFTCRGKPIGTEQNR